MNIIMGSTGEQLPQLVLYFNKEMSKFDFENAPAWFKILYSIFYKYGKNKFGYF